MWLKKLVIVLSTLAMMAAILAAPFATHVMRLTPTMVVWSLVMLAVTVTLWSGLTFGDRLLTAWFMEGALVGFVVLSLFSMGVFFVPSAGLFLVAAVVQLVRFRGWSALLDAGVSFGAGGSCMCVAFLAADIIRGAIGQMTVTHTPVLVRATEWLLPATIVLLGARLFAARGNRA